MQEIKDLGKTTKCLILLVGICMNPFNEAIPLSPSPSLPSLHPMRMVSFLELEVSLVSFLWFLFFGGLSPMSFLFVCQTGTAYASWVS